ncbi:hypothetical protein MetMK1DRAFT_00026900 [Metallosphaera yellowstonensis MK1]|jgi:hypothetical protein|uniref:Uncharacterized protein n=1 Tax=Metallosphaera yellowstonensis MK1 TaxID=671065 RepID=H2C7Z1_9CREN|nr:hypothetical protein [Metallosphaera yellowstonensis]EHP68267.1 hypothetical protein MetMK1DRAFT_00026900 [Metallosphaera yellowstonensis MK1]
MSRKEQSEGKRIAFPFIILLGTTYLRRMNKREEVRIEKKGNRITFDGIEEALSINEIHISEPKDRRLHILLDGPGLIITLTEDEFISIASSLKGVKLKPLYKTEISQIGVVIRLEADSLHVIVVMDWSLHSIFSNVDGERIRLDFGPLCEYNDCIYYAFFSKNNWIYMLKMRSVDGQMDVEFRRISPHVLKNELVFYTLGNKFGLL